MNPANQGVAAPQAPLSLLHKFSADPQFRARLESDPVGTFAEHGIQVKAPAKLKIATGIVAGDDSVQDKWLGVI